MSFDVGILITNESKRKRINLVEVNLSSGYKSTVGHYKTAEEALKALEEKEIELAGEGVGYEAVFVEGFRSLPKRYKRG